MRKSLEERFWSKVNRGGLNECWEWSAGVGWNQYGRFWCNGKTLKAHRVSYEMLVGPIPKGLTIDHLCSNPRCVNPAHMEPVTMRENVMRGDTPAARNASKTSCVNGHPFDETNTYITSLGNRFCRACNKERSRRYRSYKKEQLA